MRDERLIELSKMVLNGGITHKIDHIASVYINGRNYFNVFRRYNSPYNIVIEDNNTDIYLHQDYTIRTSLQNILCLPDWEADNIYMMNTISYKHNGPIPSSSYDIADMRWTDIQAEFYAINVNFGGIFEDNYSDMPPLTPIAQIKTEPVTPPGAPIKAEMDAVNTLLSISIPVTENPFILRECDGPTLSMRFADIRGRTNEHISCYCQMDDDDDDDYNADSDNTDSDNSGSDYSEDMNYTELRSGNRIPKQVS